jgi:hypothetical protein
VTRDVQICAECSKVVWCLKDRCFCPARDLIIEESSFRRVERVNRIILHVWCANLISFEREVPRSDWGWRGGGEESSNHSPQLSPQGFLPQTKWNNQTKKVAKLRTMIVAYLSIY